MGIKLTLKQDQLVPINALKEWSKKTLEPIQNEGSEVSSIFVKMFDTATGKPEKYREYAGMVNNVIKELPAPTQEKGNRAWFLRVFLQPFGGKATKEAEELFKVLAKGFGNKASFADIEKAADDYNNKLKGLTTEVATNARDLNNFLMNDFAVAVRDFSTAYKQAKEAPAAAAAPTGTPAGGPPAAQPDTAASAATMAAQKTGVSEKVSRELYQSKKLLELGFVTENEHLAKLVEVRNLLIENAEAPAEATTGAAQTADASVPVDYELDEQQSQKAFNSAVETNGGKSITRLQWKQALLTLLRAPAAASMSVAPLSWDDMFTRLHNLKTRNPDLLQSFYTNLNVQPSDGSPERNEKIASAVLAGAKSGTPAAQQVMNQVFQGLATVDSLKTQNTIDEAKNQLAVSTKLLKMGFITENEHLAKLVEIKTRLLEVDAVTASTPAPPDEAAVDKQLTVLGYRPETITKGWEKVASIGTNRNLIVATDLPTAQAPQAAPQQQQSNQADNVDKGIETLIGTAQKQGEISLLASRASGLQDTMTRFSQGLVSEALSYREKKLAMLYTKKQVLAEYVKTGIKPEKTQLNEFLLTGLILAALAGALAWAASKLGSLFKDSYPRYSSGPSHSSGTGDPQKDLSELANSLASGIDASGKLVDANGRQVPAIGTEINRHVEGLTNIQNAIAAGVNEISKKENHPNQTIYPQIQTQLTAVTQNQSKIEPAVNKLLASLKNFVTEATKV